MQTPMSLPSNLLWQDMPMPNGTGAVRLSLLQSVMPEHFWALVAFPAGWQRLCSGHYNVDEDFLLLWGDLSINDDAWQPCEFGFIAAHGLREETHSKAGALVLARFYGRPRWQTGPVSLVDQAQQTAAQSVHHSQALSDLAIGNLANHGDARAVYSHVALTNWVVPENTRQSLSANATPMDTFDLSMNGDMQKRFPAFDASSCAHWVSIPLVP